MDVINFNSDKKHFEEEAFRVVVEVCSYLGYTPVPKEMHLDHAVEGLVSKLKMNERGVFSTSCNFEQINGLDLFSIKDIILRRQDENFVLIGNEKGGITDRYTWFVANIKNFVFVSKINLQREINDDINQNSLLKSFARFDDLVGISKDKSLFPGKPFIYAEEIFPGTFGSNTFYIVDGKILPAAEFDKAPSSFDEYVKYCGGK